MLEIKTYSPKSHKIKCLIYGASGTGKTTFGGSAEDVVFASVENGLLSIADKKVAFAEIKTLEDFEQLRDFLRDEEHKFKTLVIDSITEINNQIKESIEKRIGKEMKIKEWLEVSNKIKKVISSIKEIDMNVIIIAQEQIEKDGEVIQKIIPSLNGKIATEICYFMDIVGYVRIDNQGNRKLITAPNEKLLTKDRTGKIGNNTELDFQKWVNLVNEISLEEEEVLYTIMTNTEKALVEKVAQFEIYKKELNKCKTIECLEQTYKSINKALITIAHQKEINSLTTELKNNLTPKNEDNLK